ncbi:SH3 domain-containing protein [Devosia sp.]|uniref:SH3 domain-containing protein n=1 Tax=Devosia sp. TaxID=1871048 RepID=UPI003BA8A656
MTPIKSLGSVAVLFATLLTPSLAQAATATSAVNVRSAPVNGAIVDTLRPGQQVEIDRCQSNGWCYVIKSGPDGWVSANYLSNDGEDDALPSRPSRPSADVSIGFSVPGFSFQIGNGGFDIRPDRPTRPGRNDQVCFYEDNNFRGDSFCARPGERLSSIGNWNDEISSIRVRGNAEALVCQDNNFRGRCVVVTRDIRSLGSANDQISSIRVR